MKDSAGNTINGPAGGNISLTELLRNSARELINQAVEAAVQTLSK